MARVECTGPRSAEQREIDELRKENARLRAAISAPSPSWLFLRWSLIPVGLWFLYWLITPGEMVAK